MKIKALMRRKIKGTIITSMTNETYKRKCKTTLKEKISQINKTYSDSLNEAGKFYVR